MSSSSDITSLVNKIKRFAKLKPDELKHMFAASLEDEEIDDLVNYMNRLEVPDNEANEKTVIGKISNFTIWFQKVKEGKHDFIYLL